MTLKQVNGLASRDCPFQSSIRSAIDPAVEAVLARLKINTFIIPSLQQGPPGATHPGTANPATDVANEDVLVTVLVGQRAAAVTLEME